MLEQKISNFKNIIVASSGELIGDGITKLPFLKALRQVFSQQKIIWLTTQSKTVFNTSLRNLSKPYIDEIIEQSNIGYKIRHLGHFGIRGPKADLLLDTQNKILVTWALKALASRHFISSAGNWFFSDIKGQKIKNVQDRLFHFLELITSSSIARDHNVTIDKLFCQQAEALLPRDNYVLLAPGAGDRRKCWPLKHYRQLAQAISAEGFTPVFILGPAEYEWHQQLSDINALFPLQKTPYVTAELTIALGQRARLIVHNDSGVGHLLAASSKPLISLFGHTPSKKFAKKNSTIINAQMFNSENMKDIPVLYVLNILRGQLMQQRRSEILPSAI